MTHEKRLRDSDEIQRAHDMLAQILLDPDLREVMFHEDDIPCISCAASVLCWVLHHDHNTKFAANLADVARRLEAMGGVVFEIKPN